MNYFAIELEHTFFIYILFGFPCLFSYYISISILILLLLKKIMLLQTYIELLKYKTNLKNVFFPNNNTEPSSQSTPCFNSIKFHIPVQRSINYILQKKKKGSPYSEHKINKKFLSRFS